MRPDGFLHLRTIGVRSVAKYRFVIEHVETQPTEARLLEFGCSRGYLTSYLILSGRDILAADSSTEAIETAKAYFGPHFVLADSPRIVASGPYDLIYHVGTIGCVADPIAFTRCLLRLLKPRGRLVFNAPQAAMFEAADDDVYGTGRITEMGTFFRCASGAA